MPFVYLLRCRDGSLYAGAAVDLDRRLAEHRAGRAARYTRSRLPVDLVWSREVADWSEALRAEACVKRLRRDDKLALVAAGVGEENGRDAGGGGVRPVTPTRGPSG